MNKHILLRLLFPLWICCLCYVMSYHMIDNTLQLHDCFTTLLTADSINKDQTPKIRTSSPLVFYLLHKHHFVLLARKQFCWTLTGTKMLVVSIFPLKGLNLQLSIREASNWFVSLHMTCSSFSRPEIILFLSLHQATHPPTFTYLWFPVPQFLSFIPYSPSFQPLFSFPPLSSSFSQTTNTKRFPDHFATFLHICKSCT